MRYAERMADIYQTTSDVRAYIDLAAEADAELARKDERIAALEASLRERDGGAHDNDCRIWTSGWEKKADKFCTCGHIEARALLERKP